MTDDRAERAALAALHLKWKSWQVEYTNNAKAMLVESLSRGGGFGAPVEDVSKLCELFARQAGEAAYELAALLRAGTPEGER